MGKLRLLVPAVRNPPEDAAPPGFLLALEDQLIPLFSSECLPVRAGGRQLRRVSVKLEISVTVALRTLVPADTLQVFIFHLLRLFNVVLLLAPLLRACKHSP